MRGSFRVPRVKRLVARPNARGSNALGARGAAYHRRLHAERITAGGGTVGKLLARLRGQNAKRAATSVAPVVGRQRFKLSLPCRSKKGTPIDDDRHSCSSDLSGKQWRRVDSRAWIKT